MGELQVAVVMQGECRDELPENVWGCASLHRVSLEKLLCPGVASGVPGSAESIEPGSPVSDREEASWSLMSPPTAPSSSSGPLLTTWQRSFAAPPPAMD